MTLSISPLLLYLILPGSKKAGSTEVPKTAFTKQSPQPIIKNTGVQCVCLVGPWKTFLVSDPISATCSMNFSCEVGLGLVKSLSKCCEKM